MTTPDEPSNVVPIRPPRSLVTALDRRPLDRDAGTGRGLDGHDHHGPDPCPRCGGIRPAKLR